jgi:hypothetical protein
MNFTQWDNLEIEIAECVLARSVPFPEAIRIACNNQKSASAKMLLLAAMSVVLNSEEFFIPITVEERMESYERYKIIAALAADVVVLRVGQDTCGDLSAFWSATGDEFFRA